MYNTVSKENNAKLIFVYIPEFRRYSGTKYSDENYNKIVSIVKKLDTRRKFRNAYLKL